MSADILLAKGEDVEKLKEEKADITYVDEKIVEIPATYKGENPNIDNITETGLYSYINAWNELDLLIVRNYPGRYVVQYRFTANSIDRRFCFEGSTQYTSWGSIAGDNFPNLGKAENIKYVNGDIQNVSSALDDLYKRVEALESK